MARPKAPELVISGLAAVLLVGAGAGLLRGAAGADLSKAPDAVEIAGFAFGPEDLVVVTGTTVTWTNRDQTTHTITGDGAEVLSSPDLGAGGTYEVTFDRAGSYEYFCRFHPNMHGTVVVEGGP